MAAKKKILVLSANAGFGHRSAAMALVAAAESARASECDVVLANPLDCEKTPAWLREVQSDYDRLARDMPQLYKLGYDLSDKNVVSKFVENALGVLLFRSLRQALRSHEPDVVVSTYPLYQAPLGLAFAMEGRAVPLVCVVTDLATVHQIWFSRESDLTIVPTGRVRDLALEAGLEPGRVEVIGIPVHPRISAEARPREELRRSLGWDPRLATVLAVGSKRVGRLPEALNALNHSGLPIQIAAAAGGDDSLYQKLRSIDWHVPAKVYNFVEDLPSMMRAADLIVSKAGGLIVTESLAAGLPLVLVDCLPGQEVGNADYVVKGGAGELCEDPIRCLETVCHWLGGGGRLLGERAAAARALGRPRAAFDVVDRALALAGEGPRRIEKTPPQAGFRELFDRFGESWED